MALLNEVEFHFSGRGVPHEGITLGRISENRLAIIEDHNILHVFHFERGTRFWEREFSSALQALDYASELLGVAKSTTTSKNL
jgi:hypothetical protein